jgi:hypothetical protein
MLRPITWVLAALITVGGVNTAFSYCAKNFFAAGDLLAWRVHSGFLGDPFNPLINFGESKSLDPYAAPFSKLSSCTVVAFRL